LSTTSQPFNTDELRSSFLDFFVARGHTLVGSSSLVPEHPAAPLFTNAGMVQFLPVFFGEEAPPWPRASSSQKCLRVRGKHDDIEIIGRSTRHLTFFEMLGNFSFGDYFKAEAIQYAWEFLTETLGLEGERMWATVHTDDDEAAQLWNELVGLPAERIQRMGEDNFWEMGATGPCGPSSEIFYDKGPKHGPDGGPAGGGEERYVEIWNLVFMQSNRLEDGSLRELPKRNIDTGAGLERILPIVQGKSSVFDTDVLRRLIGCAEELTRCVYGREEEDDVSLRIVADHARAVTFMLADGVVPSNLERGYVLRRIIRRAVRHGQRIGAREGMMGAMAAAVTEAMGYAYPELGRSLNMVSDILEREEHRFVETLSLGLGMLEDLIDGGVPVVLGSDAFMLHDTYGFPVELTAEIAAERKVGLDIEGFERAMERQRELARSAAAGGSGDEHQSQATARLVAELGGLAPTEFLGYEQLEAQSRLLRVLESESDDPAHPTLEVFVERTPFYAESGGQVGDTGTIESETGRARVIDTDRPLEGIIRHRARLEQGTLVEGQEATLQVDEARREAIRRSHTATHLLHWALRTTFGSQLQQQGSLVEPDYLRFDFNHHAQLEDEEIAKIEELVIGDILSDEPVETTESTLESARAQGAMSFFGDKYGEIVRVVRAGEHSVELCGGTHVPALGRIGAFVVRSESSVGANLRRIEALTGKAAHEDHRRSRGLLHTVADSLHVAPDSLPEAISRLQSSLSQEERQRKALAAQADRELALTLVESAVEGSVVARLDDRDQQALRVIAAELIARPEITAVGLIGSPDGEAVALAVAFDCEGDDAPGVVRSVAKLVGGGGGGKDRRLAVGGGRDVSAIDGALEALRARLSSSPATSAERIGSVNDTADEPAPAYHLFLDTDELAPATSALRLLISDEAHEPQIRGWAREVIASLQAPPDERGKLTVTLGPEQMKITHTAVKLLLDDLQRGQADEREILRGILEKLPDEHTMRAIRLP
jgi:alanyl-tRNA synthetase